MSNAAIRQAGFPLWSKLPAKVSPDADFLNFFSNCFVALGRLSHALSPTSPLLRCKLRTGVHFPQIFPRVTVKKPNGKSFQSRNPCHFSFFWWTVRESNPQPDDFKAYVLVNLAKYQNAAFMRLSAIGNLTQSHVFLSFFTFIAVRLQ